ncbi:hypothetical protein [Mailhella sp.]
MLEKEKELQNTADKGQAGKEPSLGCTFTRKKERNIGDKVTFKAEPKQVVVRRKLPSDMPFQPQLSPELASLEARLRDLEGQARSEQNLLRDVSELRNNFREAVDELNVIYKNTRQRSDEVDLLIENISQKADTQLLDADERSKALFKQAEDILSKLSIGELCEAFVSEIERREKELGNTRKCFYWLLFALILFTLVMLFSKDFGIPGCWSVNPTEVLLSGFRILLIETPLIWLTNVFSRRMHIQERILEEYIHKKTVALTYTSVQSYLQKQYGDLSSAKAETILKAFTEGFAMAALRDPCDFYDKQPRVDNPLYRLADTLKETVSSAKESK